MTRKEFLLNIPDIIQHKTWGYGELQVMVDRVDRVGVCYRHPGKSASCGTYGSNWKAVYDDLSSHLKKEGYMK